jgi:hypothetical protein
MAVASRELFEVGVDAFNAHDLCSFAELFADDVVFRAPGVAGVGKPACVDFYRRWFNDFPDARVEVRKIHLVGDVIVEEGTFTGTHDGVGRTGRSVHLDYVQVLRVADAKLISFTLTLDRLLMLEQLGLVPGEEPHR